MSPPTRKGGGFDSVQPFPEIFHLYSPDGKLLFLVSAPAIIEYAFGTPGASISISTSTDIGLSFFITSTPLLGVGDGVYVGAGVEVGVCMGVDVSASPGVLVGNGVDVGSSISAAGCLS